MKYSVVIPVYNRPDELREILESLARQTSGDFEVIIVDDGSEIRSDSLVSAFGDRLRVKYFYKPNSGPGPSRNFGFNHAAADLLLLFDSDCIIPPSYFEVLDGVLSSHHYDAWGGPDRPSAEFTPLQQAMGFTMSSAITTGGIRGKANHLGWFQPRSFNMGMTRAVFDKTGGFGTMRYAEDIDLSIRIREAGFSVGLIPEAFVYHKRRNSLGEFYHQVFNFGKGRAAVSARHPGQEKVAHWLPLLFTAGLTITILFLLFGIRLFLVPAAFYIAYFGTVAVSCWINTRDMQAAVLSIPCAGIQLIGYGLGFLTGKLGQ